MSCGCASSSCPQRSPVTDGGPVYDTIVVGAGPAGTMAAATLAKAGKRVLLLEAQDRVGGRVYTAPFGDGTVELGAEWIHGTENSAVYELAQQNNVSIIPQGLEFKVMRSDGSDTDSATMHDLLTFTLGVLEEPPAEPESVGHFITRRVTAYIEEKYPHLYSDKDFMENYLKFADQVINNYESSNSWNDVSTASHYQELGGNQHMSWHTHGYKTLFDIILNKYKGGPGLPTLTLKLSTEVVGIKWPQESGAPVEVTTKDGSVYKAQNVIVTVSLGVLKERHATLFSPPLPEEKVRAIENVSFGVVAKVILRFPNRWCQYESCLFIWKSGDAAAVPEADKWLTMSEGVSVPMSCKTCGTLWLNGDRAKLMETLPDDVVKTKVMGVIRQFFGASVPDPIDMIRSSWFSNPFTRGAYSYDNILTPQHPGARAVLAAPLPGAGAPRVLFAGEATNPTHFSTVHGALETGRREAARLLQPPSKL